jgi:hypothetical protein
MDYKRSRCSSPGCDASLSSETFYPTEDDLLRSGWSSLGLHYYCGKCITRVLAARVDELLDEVKERDERLDATDGRIADLDERISALEHSVRCSR